MKSEKFKKVLIGLGIIALGVLLAVYGPADVLRLYFGIIACSVGGAFAIYGIFLLSKKQSVPSFAFIAGGGLISIGVGLLVGKIETAVIIQVIVYAVLGVGAGLTLFGIYLLGRKVNFSSIVHLVGGIAIVTFAILFLTIDDFAKIFWIVIGILIALYGLLSIVMLFIPQKEEAVEAEVKIEEKPENKDSKEVKEEEPEVTEPKTEEPKNEEEGD